MAQCPRCGQGLLSHEVECPRCQWVPSAAPKKSGTNWIILAVLVLVVVILVFWWLGAR